MGTGLLTTGKGCPGSTEYRPEDERTPDAEYKAEMKRLIKLIHFVKGNDIKDPQTGLVMTDANPEKKRLARERFCRLRKGEEGTEDNFETFVNLCLLPLTSVSEWRNVAFCRTISKSFTISDEAFAMLILENNIDDFDQLVTDLFEPLPPGQSERTVASLPDRKNTKSRYTKGDSTKRGTGRKITVEEAKRRKVSNNLDGLSRFQGWTADGIARFNELYEEVKKYRDTDEGRAADQKVWKRYMKLCNVSTGNSETESTDENEDSESNLQEVSYEDGVDDFAGLMVML